MKSIMKIRMNIIKSVTNHIGMLVLLAGAGAATAGSLSGTASYRERVMLPDNAVFEAELQDVSLADAPALPLARARIVPAGAPPFRFTLKYDDADIRARHSYNVRAVVRVGERLLFVSDRMHPVLDGGTDALNIPLIRVDVHRLAEPEAMVEADAPLRNTYWKLAGLKGRPVGEQRGGLSGKGGREAHLVFAADADRVSGSGGCNRLTGVFRVDGDKLRFGQIAGTLMACMDGMVQEQALLGVLPTVASYRLRGPRLELLNDSGVVAASFVAVR